MKILIDQSPAGLARARADWPGADIGQLVTPLTRNRLDLVGRYAIDNGAFTRFNPRAFRRLLERVRAASVGPLFVALPDVVGDAEATLERFETWKASSAGLPRALVLQNGIGRLSIPWADLVAVFVGGDDAFKQSAECFDAVLEARDRGAWIHVGRCSTPDRIRAWHGVADSIDGTGLARFRARRDEALGAIRDLSKQHGLFAST